MFRFVAKCNLTLLGHFPEVLSFQFNLLRYHGVFLFSYRGSKFGETCFDIFLMDFFMYFITNMAYMQVCKHVLSYTVQKVHF